MTRRNTRVRERVGDGQSYLFLPETRRLRVARRFRPENDVTLYRGDCLDLLRSIPDQAADLVVTSPPYNLGKAYEKKLDLDLYVTQQSRVIRECIRILSLKGSICWEVGNYVHRGAIIPLDALLYPIFATAGLRMRNRIVWRFEHRLHWTRRSRDLMN